MKETIYKALYELGVPSLLRLSKKNTATVLSLHRISEDRDYFFDPITPKNFEKLLDYCCKYYTVTSFDQINKETSKPKIILSFDDGYQDFIEIALPILKKKGLPSNHNIVNVCANNNETIWTQKLNDVFNFLKSNSITDNEDIAKYITFKGNWISYYMGIFSVLLQTNRTDRNDFLNTLVGKYNVISKYRMMNWDEIIYCSNNDVEIGSHTYNHDSLISIKDVHDFKIEINQSIDEISNKIGKQVTILALPNGQYNSDVIDNIKNTSIRYTLLVDDNINPTPLKSNLISRIGLGDDSIYQTALKTELFHSKIKRLYG